MTTPLPMLPSWPCPSNVWVVHLQSLCAAYSQSLDATSSRWSSKMFWTQHWAEGCGVPQDTSLWRGRVVAELHETHCEAKSNNPRAQVQGKLFHLSVRVGLPPGKCWLHACRESSGCGTQACIVFCTQASGSRASLARLIRQWSIGLDLLCKVEWFGLTDSVMVWRPKNFSCRSFQAGGCGSSID